MLNNFILSVNAVVPIFLLILLGIFIKRKKLLDDHSIGHMNAIVFNCALPVMLFRDVYRADFAQMLDVVFIGYAALSSVAAFAFIWFFAVFFLKDKASVGTFVQGAFRSNYAIVGLPIIANILGDLDTGKGALLTTVVVPVSNVLSVIALTFSSSELGDRGRVVRGALKNIVKNPLIIGVCIGSVFSLLSIRLPRVFATSVDLLGSMTTPLALIAIGGSMHLGESLKRIRPGIAAAFIKLLALPLIFVPIGFWLKLDAEELVVLFVLYGAPTAISSYVMTVNMKGDQHLSINIILLTTLFSVITFMTGAFLFYTYVL